MNLEMIQSRMQDIERMRQASRSNESTLMNWQGRTGTDSVIAEHSASSFSFRLFLACFILAALIYADYQDLPKAGNLLQEVKEAISYNINSEDMENLEEIWYTISDTLPLDYTKGSN